MVYKELIQNVEHMSTLALRDIENIIKLNDLRFNRSVPLTIQH